MVAHIVAKEPKCKLKPLILFAVRSLEGCPVRSWPWYRTGSVWTRAVHDLDDRCVRSILVPEALHAESACAGEPRRLGDGCDDDDLDLRRDLLDASRRLEAVRTIVHEHVHEHQVHAAAQHVGIGEGRRIYRSYHVIAVAAPNNELEIGAGKALVLHDHDTRSRHAPRFRIRIPQSPRRAATRPRPLYHQPLRRLSARWQGLPSPTSGCPARRHRSPRGSTPCRRHAAHARPPHGRSRGARRC